jgi:hypothetical protein
MRRSSGVREQSRSTLMIETVSEKTDFNSILRRLIIRENFITFNGRENFKLLDVDVCVSVTYLSWCLRKYIFGTIFFYSPQLS